MLSRRHFLQLTGIALAAQHLPGLTLPAFAPAAVFEPIYGRALASIPVYTLPNINAPLVQYLWSDTVVSISPDGSAWYRVPRGYARREHLQPMIAPVQQIEATTTPSFWAEVSAPVAIVRMWCDASAPIVTRIGHGGVLRVIDLLPGDGIDWYGVTEAEGTAVLGWTQASAWSPAHIDDAFPDLTLHVDVQAQRMSVLKNDQLLLRAPLSTGRNLQPGVYPITERRISLAQSDVRGVPWVLGFGGDFHLTGVYWHNRFGAAAPGAAVQVIAPLARWLYPRAATVIIS